MSTTHAGSTPHARAHHSLTHSFIHTPYWIQSQVGYVHGRVVCLCHARVRTVVLRALSVCVLWCMWSLFSRVGLARVRVPWQSPAKSRTPTPRVDTSPPRSDHIHQHTTCPYSTDLPGGRAAKDPGAPLLSAVCVSLSSPQPPGSGAAKIRHTWMENYLRQMPETTCHKSLHLAGTAQLGKCRKTAQIQKLREDRRSPG